MEKRTKLLCFDLDGTLYQDKVIYLRIIEHFFQGTPYESWTSDVQNGIQEILKGQGPIGCGQFVPKIKGGILKGPGDIFAVPAFAALVEDGHAECFDRSRYSYVSDGWTLAMYAARRIGWEGDAFWLRFQKARQELVSEQYGPQKDGQMLELLKNLREQEIRLVLCSNAAKKGAEGLLVHLGLENSFDEIIFDADKPHRFGQYMESWKNRWGISEEEMVFIGDQGYFDLYAGWKAGAQTLLVAPWETADAGLWDMRIRTYEELKEYLNQLISL